uniref:Uncharacterized protein n=1 Tax=Vespula pensylvanica TaxID=30213 RepID=A0A834NX06_VESPE|nr:hypothetical protein H0235_010387 [Vespula pensylvanica]
MGSDEEECLLALVLSHRTCSASTLYDSLLGVYPFAPNVEYIQHIQWDPRWIYPAYTKQPIETDISGINDLAHRVVRRRKPAIFAT